MNKEKLEAARDIPRKYTTFPGYRSSNNTENDDLGMSISPYEEYLNLLQERNRMRRKLKKKTKLQVALERREKGFTLYLNGANAERDKNTSPLVCRKFREMEGFPFAERLSDTQYNTNISPSPKTIRRNWLLQSLEFKSQDGRNVRVCPPKSCSPTSDNSSLFDVGNIRSSRSTGSLDSNRNSYFEASESENDDSDETEIEERIASSSQSTSNSDDVEECFSSASSPTVVGPEIGVSNCWEQYSEKSKCDTVKRKRQDTMNNSSFSKTANDWSDEKNDVLVSLESTPKRTNKRLLSAVSVCTNPAENNSIGSNVIADVLQALQAENKSVGRTVKDNILLRCANEFGNKMNNSSEDSCQLMSSRLTDLNSNFGIKQSVIVNSVEIGAELKTTTVSFEIFSNWGHPTRIGLTEVQFFDRDKQLIWISEVRVAGASECKGDLQSLHNNKMKTVKERYMWSCAVRPEPVHLVFILLSKTNIKPVISSIKIWNFNHSIKDLLIGARQVRICIEGETVFDGILDKGCGNQVFDYGQTISINDSCKKSDDAVEALVIPKSDFSYDLNMNEKNLGLGKEVDGMDGILSPLRVASAKERQQGGGRDSNEQRRTQSGVAQKREEEFVVHSVTKFSGDVLNTLRSSTAWKNEANFAHSKLQNLERDGYSTQSTSGIYSAYNVGPSSNLDSPAKIKSSTSLYYYPDKRNDESGMCSDRPVKPKWLDMYPKDEMQCLNPGEKPSWLKGLDINMTEPFIEPNNSRNSSRRSSVVSLTGSQPRRYDSEPLLEFSGLELRADSASKAKDVPDAFSSEDRPSRESSAKYGRRAIPSPIPSSGDPRRRQVPGGDQLQHQLSQQQPREESARTRIRRTFDRNLEESWTSLHMFNQHHRGRLSVNMEGDVLDGYLNSEKLPKSEAVIIAEREIDFTPIESTKSDFIIPELPEGQNLVVNIRTTWGDCHYVGLNGIEIFASTGEPVKVQKITATPADINILSEYSKDPRIVNNLVDGVYRTRDDMHLWLTPFTHGNDHLVSLTFDKVVKIAMIRIWNYNKSRIHSFRGAKDIEITLDKRFVFTGEIARACGGIQGGIEAFGDTILFTTDEDILESIAKNDETFSSYMSVTSSTTVAEEILLERPRTGYQLAEGERPMTCAERKADIKRTTSTWDGEIHDDVSFRCQTIELIALSNWGDPGWIGLTGVEILDEVGDSIILDKNSLSTTLSDSAATKALYRLIDGNNVSTSENHMWQAAFLDGIDHKIIICLKKQCRISGVRLWNYNRSSEDSYRGIKYLQIIVDGKEVSPADGFLIRKGPGHCHFDFAQEITFAGPPQYSLITPGWNRNSERHGYSSENVVSQDYEAPVMPRGFVFHFQLYSSWGDPYYIGLNGLELYDAVGNRIPLTENNIAAYPDSVNVLDNVSDDVRTPDKLVDKVNDTMDGHHMWLAPVLPCVINRVYVVFDYPVTVSMIKLWNYAMTPARGVKEFGLLVDDLLVYHNTLNQVPTNSFEKATAIPHHTILFTADKDIAVQERNSILRSSNLDQDVQLTNNCQVVHRGASGKIVDQALRPMTSLPPQTFIKK